MKAVLISLVTTYWVGILVNLSLFIVLAVQEFVLFRKGYYKYEQRVDKKEIFKRLWRALLITLSSWAFWLTERYTINDFYIMDD